MAGRRTAGITVTGVLNLIFGVIGILASVAMLKGVFAPAAPAGATPSALTWEFATARMLVSVGILVGGIGLLRMSPRGRTLSLRFALAWLLLNAVEPAVLHYSYAQVLIGSIYPLLLAILCKLPGWKAAFASSETAPASAPGVA
jgi:hypothetical protein